MASRSSDSSGSTLADHNTASTAPAATTVEPAHHKKPLDPDEEAEREFADFGGDAPWIANTNSTKFAPGTNDPRTPRDPNAPHNPPAFRQPSRRMSRSSVRGRPRANTGGSTWSFNDAPSLHVVDTAFSATHRAISRMSRERDEDEGEDNNESEEDPNKVTWEDDDPENPQNWTTFKKWRTMAFLTLGVTFASSAPSSSTQAIQGPLNCSSEVAELTTSLFLAGYCLGPLIFAPMSELIGRRPVFLVSMAAFGIFEIQCGLAQNIETLLIGRFLAGSFASSPLTNCGGVVADMMSPVERGVAMSVFSASVFLGPVIGPIVGGFTILSEKLGWRYIYLWIGIWAAVSEVAIIFFLPETYHPKLLKSRAKKLRKEDPERNKDKYAEMEKADFSVKSLIVRTGGRPAKMLVSEPVVLTVTLYLSVVYGTLYGLFSAFPIVWGQLRGFNLGETGLVFIGVGIGTTIGAAINIYLQRHYRVIVPMWHGHPPPEERLYGAMVAGPLLVVAMFGMGWLGNYPSIHWAAPAAFTILLGASFSLVFISFLTYLVEVYLMYSASALAANTVVRSAVAAAFPLFISQMFTKLGVGWACSVFGFIGLVLAPSPYLFYKFGPTIRQKSQFAPAIDLKLKDQVEREQREKNGEKESA
ncbi:hypothetical protein JCM10212_005535 [Sporobolomyces blumeae]